MTTTCCAIYSIGPTLDIREGITPSRFRNPPFGASQEVQSRRVTKPCDLSELSSPAEEMNEKSSRETIFAYGDKHRTVRPLSRPQNHSWPLAVTKGMIEANETTSSYGRTFCGYEGGRHSVAERRPPAPVAQLQNDPISPAPTRLWPLNRGAPLVPARLLLVGVGYSEQQPVLEGASCQLESYGQDLAVDGCEPARHR